MSSLPVERFVGLVIQSGLVPQERVQAEWEGLKESGPAGTPGTSNQLADRLVGANLLTRWQANKLLQGRHKGFILGKYRLLDHLGTGGMSSVYLAEHPVMRRRVAIKVLPQTKVADSSYLARFHREARAAAALDHPNIVRAYDVDQDGKNHYIVMEFVNGKDLQELVSRSGPLDYMQACDYVRQAADGLAHAHAANLIHRDIKPANLLVDSKGIVKILDMGLARFDDGQTSSLTIAHDEKVLGTSDYLAPEQAVHSHHVDGRADIYSLGCTLYFMLTGHPPFPDGTLAQRIVAHQTREPASIYKDRPDAPKDLVEIVRRMTCKRPADRYQSAEEVREVMSAWLSSRGGPSQADNGNGKGSGPYPVVAAVPVQAPRPDVAKVEHPLPAATTAPPLRAERLAAPQSPRQNRPLPVAARLETAPRAPGAPAPPAPAAPAVAADALASNAPAAKPSKREPAPISRASPLPQVSSESDSLPSTVISSAAVASPVAGRAPAVVVVPPEPTGPAAPPAPIVAKVGAGSLAEPTATGPAVASSTGSARIEPQRPAAPVGNLAVSGPPVSVAAPPVSPPPVGSEVAAMPADGQMVNGEPIDVTKIVIQADSRLTGSRRGKPPKEPAGAKTEHSAAAPVESAAAGTTAAETPAPATEGESSAPPSPPTFAELRGIKRRRQVVVVWVLGGLTLLASAIGLYVTFVLLG
jgi:serine/threonine-protein kinase